MKPKPQTPILTEAMIAAAYRRDFWDYHLLVRALEEKALHFKPGMHNGEAIRIRHPYPAHRSANDTSRGVENREGK